MRLRARVRTCPVDPEQWSTRRDHSWRVDLISSHFRAHGDALPLLLVGLALQPQPPRNPTHQLARPDRQWTSLSLRTVLPPAGPGQ